MQVYVDAPHLSSGELPADLPAALVNGRPTYEWWNAQRVHSSKLKSYVCDVSGSSESQDPAQYGEAFR